MTAMQTLISKASEQDTDTLLGALRILGAKGKLTEVESMTHAAICDAITIRHGLDDALDAIFMDEAFRGTYAAALVLALAAVNAR